MNGSERIATMITYLSTIQAHLARHRGLAGPFNVSFDLHDYRPNVVVQLDGSGCLATVAGGLLTWADSVTEVTAEAWRPSTGTDVHLSVSGMVGGVSVRAFDAAPFDAAVFTGLQPGQRGSIPLQRLRAWAIGSGVAA
jgi:hypothetical protein